MRKSLSLFAALAILGALALMPATAGADKVAPGSVYKGEYTYGSMHDKFRIKTYQSGTSGNFTLKCAGVVRVKFEITDDRFKLEFGADEVMVKGKGKFKGKGVVEGEISKIITPGHTCTAPGAFAGVIQDV